MKKILILGKSGFVPRQLGLELSNLGFNVFHSSRNLQNEASDQDLVLLNEEDNLPNLFFKFLQENEIDVVINTSNFFEREPKQVNSQASLAANLTVPTAALLACSFAKTKVFVNLASGWQLDANRANQAPHYIGLKNAFAFLSEAIAGQTKVWNVYVHELFGARDERPKLLPSLRKSLATGQVLRIQSGDTRIHLASLSRLAKHVSHLVMEEHDLPKSHTYINYPNLAINELIPLAEEVCGISIPWIDSAGLSERSELVAPVFGELPKSELAQDLKVFFRS